MEFTTVTTKGQVVLPVAIRGELCIEKGTKLAVITRRGTIVMKPVKKLSEFAGILKTKKSSRELVTEAREVWEKKLKRSG